MIQIHSRYERILIRLMQLILLVIIIIGALTRRVDIIVNGLVSFMITFLPNILRRDYDISIGPGLTLLITTAVLLHSVGMLGLYVTVWWWDNVAHALSASIVAAVGYTVVRAVDVHSDDIYLPPRFMFIFILLFVMAFGVLWEVLEFAGRIVGDTLGLRPVLIQYGIQDTMTDLIFDAVGALIVAAWGHIYLNDLVQSLVARLEKNY